MSTPAFLALADGTVLRGSTVGAEGYAVGEVVFNTSMTGYQEILTDPSYHLQLVTLTYPHVGNVGVNPFDSESAKPRVAGLVIRDASLSVSNWRATQDLGSYLREHGVVAIADVDTRRLTRLLRDRGTQSGCIAAGARVSVDVALAKAREFPGLGGVDLAEQVSTAEVYVWREGTWQLDGNRHRDGGGAQWRVAAYDFGVKRNLLRLLADRGCEVYVLPARTSAADALALKPDGIFLSNGPGDPAACAYAVAAIREFLTVGIPLFGICLGHQLLGLACGARTARMKFGHHGANHPVQDLRSGRVYITSQNHGFAIDEASLPETLVATHRSLFDGSLQGIAHTRAPAFGFQGHPEASSGPRDIGYLFGHFIDAMRRHKCAA